MIITKDEFPSAWIQTHTGKKFFPLDPEEDLIDIEDIGHSLSMLCRFTGHSNQFYCVSPDTKILTARLEWKEAGDIKIGENLLAFDEYPEKIHSNNRNRRKLQNSIVLHDGLIKKKMYKLFLSDGSVLKCSEEHPWLISTKKSKNQIWRTTFELFNDLKNNKKRYMLKFLEPWTQKEKNYETGYLEAILDGESYISLARRGIMIGLSQNPGPVLEKIKNILTNNNIDFCETGSGNCMTKTCQLRGKWHDKLKFIGQYQPIRLVNNFENFIQTNNWKKEFDSISLLEINHIEYIGEGDVAAIATSTKTYFADGFGAHNSVAQHSLLVSYLCDEEFALQGLLHDSSEGLGLTDINAPLKRTPIFAAYREAEKKLQSMIFRKFGCPEEEHVSVKAADQRLLVNEAHEFLSPMHPEWKNKFEPFPFRIEAMSQEEAKKEFLKRFWELREKTLIV